MRRILPVVALLLCAAPDALSSRPDYSYRPEEPSEQKKRPPLLDDYDPLAPQTGPLRRSKPLDLELMDTERYLYFCDQCEKSPRERGPLFDLQPLKQQWQQEAAHPQKTRSIQGSLCTPCN